MKCRLTFQGGHGMHEDASDKYMSIVVDVPADVAKMCKEYGSTYSHVIATEWLAPYQVGHRRYTSGKAQKKRDQNAIDNLEIAWGNIEAEGRSEATVTELAEIMEKSPDTVKRYLKKHGGFTVSFEPDKSKSLIVRRNEPGARTQI